MTKVIIASTVGLIYDGITSVIMAYLKAMDLTDLEIYVTGTIKVEPSIRKQMEDLGCAIVELPHRKKETKAYVLELAKFIRKNKIQVIHAHGNSGTLAIEMCAAWLGGCKKRIAHSHNTKCDQVKADKLLRPIFHIFYTDALACGADAGKWLFNNRPFKVLTNGRDTKVFAYHSETRESIRNKYGIKDELVIGHIGGFVPQKNHEFLLKIYKEILLIEKNIKLFMIGDGDLRAMIEEKAEAAGIREKIEFTGNIDNVPDLLSAMDGMLLPSLFEGLPLVVMEWQINGLPCIISDSITKECAVTEWVRYKSLEESPHMWAEDILAFIEDSKSNQRADAWEYVKDSCFDIIENACFLRKLYTAC